MSTIASDLSSAEALRSLAVARLKGPAAEGRPRTDPSGALRVLYELASSPSTAPDALTLLHELQVHQVELDLQDEELRRSRLELETLLHRQVQLYDCAPVGNLTVDSNAVVSNFNTMGAALLGLEREFLRGRSLEGVLTPESVSILRGMLVRLADGVSTEHGELHVRATQGGEARRVHASACRDPAGGGFLIGLIGRLGGKEQASE